MVYIAVGTDFHYSHLMQDVDTSYQTICDRVKWYIQTWWPAQPKTEYKDTNKGYAGYTWLLVHERRMLELFGSDAHPIDIADELGRPLEQIFERLRLVYVRDTWVNECFKLRNYNLKLSEDFVRHLLQDDWIVYSRYIPLQGSWFKWRMIWLDIYRSQILPEMLSGVRLNRICDFMPQISGKPVFKLPILPHLLDSDPQKIFFKAYPKRVSRCKGVLTLVNKKVVGGRQTDSDERSMSELAKIPPGQMEVKLKEFAKRFLKKVKKAPSSFYRSSDKPIHIIYLLTMQVPTYLHCNYIVKIEKT
ncbi:hypothetical protein MIR68_003520, partial [Amoeboaphelidium protococcarum]